MVVYEKTKPYYKRTPIITDVTDKIQRFGLDNLYPQRAEEVARLSYTLKSTLETIADFINGEGFQDSNIGNLKVNESGFDGQSLNDVLVATSNEYAMWKSIPLHIQYNMNYSICSIIPLPFSFCRFGVRNKKGQLTHIAYSTNWERDGRKQLSEMKICYYPIYNPDPLIVEQQIIESGGIANYKGQILFYTPKFGEYPLATFDPVFDHAQTQYELGMFKINSVQNKFLTDLAIVYPGQFETAEEKMEFQNLIKNKSGARHAGERIGLQDKTGTKKASDIFQPLSPVNTDKLFELTEKTSGDAIMENYAIPKELIGVRPESGMFNQDNMENAYTYFNSRTRNHRAIISRVFANIISHWETPIVNQCLIKPQQYIPDSEAGLSSLEVRDNLANMSGRQAQNMGRIIRKYAKGEYSYDQAKVLLQGGFGLSNEEIDKLLGKNEEQTIGPTMQNLFLALKMESSEALDIFGFKSKDFLL